MTTYFLFMLLINLKSNINEKALWKKNTSNGKVT